MVAAAVKGIVVINLAIAVLTLGRWRTIQFTVNLIACFAKIDIGNFLKLEEGEKSTNMNKLLFKFNHIHCFVF